MNPREPTRSARIEKSRPRANTSNSRPQVQRVLTGQHIDDSSVYNAGDFDAEQHSEADDSDNSETEKGRADSGFSEEVNQAFRLRQWKEQDLEAPLEKKVTTRSAKDPNLISWNGPDDPENPKNWTLGRKWAATFVVSSFTLISPLSSTMVAPALTTISRELGITNEVESQLCLSVFVLAFAVGPLFLGPLSEIYGRVPVLQLSNLVYLVFNLACGFSRNKGEMIAFRFLSGLGGSAPLAIGGGVLSDCWRAEERGRAISIYSLAPLLGPAIGPLMGAFITENTTWRWTFWATTIADGLIQIIGVVFLRETYPPKLLHRKAEQLRRNTGNTALRTEFEHPERSLANTLKVGFIRPFRLLGTQPIVQVLALYMAYLYGLLYLVLASYPTLWSNVYHERIGIGGLNYISLGVGFFFGVQITAPLNDATFRRLKKKNNDTPLPEFRVPLMIPGSLLVPCGLFIYGWSAQYHTHWIVPNLGAALFSAGVIVCFQCIQTYLIDSYTRYAASAVGAATVLRSLAGFGFPLFAPAMYDKLDYGWGNSVLGFVAVAIGFPAPFLLWMYGKRLRERSPFAAGG